MIVALVDDLLFSSKIRAGAERAGEKVSFVRARGGVLPEVAAVRPGLVILDLDRDALDPIGAIGEIRALADADRPRVVAFVRHTSADRIAAARRAGIDLVLARSAFFDTLGEIIAGASGDPQSTPPPEAS